MEGTPLSTSSDPENGFDTISSKHKRKRFESAPEDNALALKQSRHIAREALRHEEAEESFFAEAPPLSPEPHKPSPETKPAAGAEDTADDENEIVIRPHDTSADPANMLSNSVSLIANRAFEHRKRAPEAKQLHGEADAPERIGHVLITAEATKRSKEDQKPSEAEERIQLPPNKRIETLSRPELLTLSEQIAVEGSNLRHIYETHLIGEQALRRLIAEYLHGGDVVKALQREIIEHEIDFERDPALRDMAMPTDADTSETKQVIAPGKEALHQLLQKAEAGIANSNEELTYNTADMSREIKRPKHQYQHQKLPRRPVDVIMGMTIVVLVILVITLYFRHH